jgi:hypothetical protein
VATAMSQFVGPSVAEELEIPYRCVLFCPAVLDGLHGRGFDELFGEPLDTHRGSIGLPRWVTSAGSCSPLGRCWLPTRPWAPGVGRGASTSGRRVRGSCPTGAHSRPNC